MPQLIDALRDPARYPHPVREVEVVETHISWVLLAGEYAYKIKKPVRLAFLDFSTLAARLHYCEEELRLNRRTAPALYLDVLPVVQTASGPSFAGDGTPIEYAVRMRRFPSEALADSMARNGELGAESIDALAAVVAAFHAAAPRAGSQDRFGSPEEVAAPALANFDQLGNPGGGPGAARLRAWTASECARLAPVFASRRAAGRVRECHGDLHLGNVAFIAGRPVPFDCIEFDPALRWIDVVNEVAFLVMDLHAHGMGGSAWRLLNRWLEATGDYEGVRVLRFYLVYRAVVRVKIAGLRGRAQEFASLLALAESLAGTRRRALVVMHGLSGSGKTTLAQELVERAGAVRVRSDVERKRLHGIDNPLVHAPVRLDAGLYGAAASERTYRHLEDLARVVVEAGYPVVVDAAFLRRKERDRFRRLAIALDADFLVAACTAQESTLRQRVAEREVRGSDASDAGVGVLERQLATWEPLAPDEDAYAVSIDSATAAATGAGLERVAARLSGSAIAAL